jgi:two-component system KDP operon response regulator KdpE
MINDDAHVLVVDDDIGIQRALQRSLSAYGYEVSAVSTGEEALEEISRERPDLVLLDLGLPGMSGLEVCEKIRAESNLPIILIRKAR